MKILLVVLNFLKSYHYKINYNYLKVQCLLLCFINPIHLYNNNGATRLIAPLNFKLLFCFYKKSLQNNTLQLSNVTKMLIKNKYF